MNECTRTYLHTQTYKHVNAEEYTLISHYSLILPCPMHMYIYTPTH